MKSIISFLIGVFLTSAFYFSNIPYIERGIEMLQGSSESEETSQFDPSDFSFFQFQTPDGFSCVFIENKQSDTSGLSCNWPSQDDGLNI